ncbi:MAG: tetratricopeptide repeat protein [Archangium sp.]|nr:tetratricopeptide repeat protein [Archangium sp.]
MKAAGVFSRWFDYANYQLWLFALIGLGLSAFRGLFPLPSEDPPARIFELAVAIDPAYAQGHYNLGILHQNAGRSAEAVAEFRLAAAADPLDHRVCGPLGKSLARLKAWDEAVVALRCALAAEDEWSSHDRLGSVFAAQGKLREAVSELEVALRMNPSENRVRIDLGGLLAQLGEYPRAETLLLEATRRDPRDPRALFDLGLVARRQGQLARAEQRFEQVLTLDPSHVKALGNLGRMAMERGDFVKARRHLEALLRADPDNVQAQGLLRQVP